MTCAAILAIAGAILAPTQGGDVIIVAPHPTAAAQVCYSNDGAQSSLSQVLAVTIDGLTISLGVQVNIAAGAERLTISPPLGYMVFPADLADVEVMDGESVTALIFAGVS